MSYPTPNLTNICRPKQWKTLSMSDLLSEGYPVYGANGIIGYYNKYTHELPTLLITCRGATCGEINICRPKSYVNGNAMALDDLDENVNIRYLSYYLKKRGFMDVISGSAQPQITRQGLNNIKIPLPPLETQKKIAATLDKADELRQNDKKILEKYDQLAQSVFLEMFGDPRSSSYPFKKLAEVCLKINDGEHGTVKRQDSGKLYLMARNVRENFIDLNEVSYISEKDHQRIYNRCNPETGDILLVCVGATIGRLSIVPQMENFSLARSVALLKPNRSIVDSIYLYSILNSAFGQENIIRSRNTSAQSGLYIGNLKQIQIPVPPIDLQKKFGDIIENIEQQRKISQSSLIKSEDLFQSLLHRAFRGELVHD